MRDPFLQAKQTRELERFVISIDPETICRLASSYQNGRSCRIFRPYRHGSFNVCFFVEFDPPNGDKDSSVAPDRWVVRLPIAPRLAFVDEKLESEVATMRYVAAKTTIPVPQVHAWSTAKDSPIGLAFLIMDYVEGKTLSQLGFLDGPLWEGWDDGEKEQKAVRAVHRELADVFIQLRKLVFPTIGALGLPPGDAHPTNPTAGPDQRGAEGITVRHRPLPMEVMHQELEGHGPTAAFPPGKTFSTAREYVEALLWLSDNLLDKTNDCEIDTRDERMVVYGIHAFKRYVLDEWLEKRTDKGPFVLAHADLGFHGNNLLWDENLRLVAVLDWEWSHVVPVQLFVPPAWLNGDFGLLGLCSRSFGWQAQVRWLLAAIRKREAALGLQSLLSFEWVLQQFWPHTLIALTLFRPESTFETYWNFLTFRLESLLPISENIIYGHLDDMARRMDEYFEQTPEAKALMERKVRDQDEFDKQWAKRTEEDEDCQCQSCKDKAAEEPPLDISKIAESSDGSDSPSSDSSEESSGGPEVGSDTST